MNLRKIVYSDLLMDKLNSLNLNDSSILVCTVDTKNIKVSEMEEIVKSLFDGLKQLNMERPILVLPDGFSLQQIPEIEMNKMGWYRK